MDNNGHNRINEEKSDVYINTMIYNILCNLMSPFLPPCAVLTCGNSQKSKDADIKGIAAWRRKIIVFAVNLIIQWFQHFSLFILDMFHSKFPKVFESENIKQNCRKYFVTYHAHICIYIYIYILKVISFC